MSEWRKRIRRMFSDNPDAPPEPKPEVPPVETWPKLHRSAHGTLMEIFEDGSVRFPEQEAVIKASVQRHQDLIWTVNKQRAAEGKHAISYEQYIEEQKAEKKKGYWPE